MLGLSCIIKQVQSTTRCVVSSMTSVYFQIQTLSLPSLPIDGPGPLLDLSCLFIWNRSLLLYIYDLITNLFDVLTYNSPFYPPTHKQQYDITCIYGNNWFTIDTFHESFTIMIMKQTRLNKIMNILQIKCTDLPHI